MTLHRIGNYELLGELGRGGMGVVYRGVDSFIKRPVAIKTIYLSEIQDDQERQFLRERLYREAQSAGILSHPNIVTIYQIGEQDEITYIAMEFVDGPNLAQILRQREQGKVSMEFLVSVFEQTASGLDHAHSQGVIHRDIKPANIIVRNDGIAKITDFGVAKISSQTVTRTGMTLGTPHFMAPEQIQGKKLDGRADQYSLGVVMYEAITGKRPFTADSMTTLIFRIVSDPVDPKRDNPHLSDAVSEVLKRALAKHAEERFPNCEALARAFREAVGLGGAATGSTGSFVAGSPLGGTGTQPYRIPTSMQPAAGSGMQQQASAGLPPTGTARTAPPVPTAAPMPMPPATPSAPPTLGQSTGSSSATPPARQEAQPSWSAPAAAPWQSGSGSGTPATGVPATPVPRRNAWLVPLLVIVGLAVVGGIFGIFKLVTGGQGTATPGAGSGTTIASAPGTAHGADASGALNGFTDQGNSGSERLGEGQASGGVGAPPVAGMGSSTGLPPAAEKPSAPATPAAKSPAVATGTPPPDASGTASGSTRPGAAGSAALAPVTTAGRAAAAKPGAQTGITVTGSTPPAAAKPAAAAPSTSQPSAPAGWGEPPKPLEEGPAPSTPSAPAAVPAVTVAPRPTLRVPAVYPSAARREGVGGTVGLRAMVNTSGVPTNIEVVKGIRPDLDEAAKEALAKWRFQPGTSDGKPVEARVNVEITFSLVQDARKPVSLRNP